MIAGRYTLDTEIGRGGMGVVWRGTDTLLGREVALKKVGWLPGAEAPDLARAAREARLAATVSHAHVVAVFDLVSHDDEQWLVMEYVESRNLAQLVQENGPLPVDQAARLLGQAADALAAAHRAGIVHRDVKPSNILVTPSGRVKLTDFGIARSAGDATLTMTGMVTGSPAYLAPEVAAGAPATPASDVWALGATLFHALTGHPPYDTRASVVTALYRIVHEEPPRPAEAGALLPLLEVTMARDPERRLPMAAVRDRLLAPAPLTPEPALLVGAAPTATAVLPLVPEPEAAGDLADPTWAQPPVPTRPATGPREPSGPSEPPFAAPVPASGPPSWEPPASPSASSASAPDAPATQAGRPRRLGRLLTVVVVSAALGLAGLVLAARQLGGGTADGSSAAVSSQQRTPTRAAASATADPSPTGEELTGFVEDYLATVTSRPAAAWSRLTPQFQAVSGGYDSYVGFWGGIASAELLSVDPDPANLTVEYSVRYRKDTGSVLTDRVTLQLQRDGDGFLISGER